MDNSLVVAIVLIAAGVLALEVGISAAIIEIFAGVLLGYFVQGVSSMEWLQFLAQFGILGLMFAAGFEIDIGRIRSTWKASVGIGILSLGVPCAGVYALSRLVFGLEPRVALLMGIGLSTTSLALTYQSLKDRGLLSKESGLTLMGAATVVDTLSMVALALILGDVGWGTALFLLFVVPTIIGLPRMGQWIFRRYRGSAAEIELRLLLMVLLGMGIVAKKAGIHPAIMAFTVGLVLAELVQDYEELEGKLKGIVFSFLAPIFFLQAGAQINLRLIDGDVLRMAAVMFVAAYGLKYLGTMLPTRWLTEINAHFAGILMNYQLTFGIITATVGLEVGILDQRLYSVILLMVVGSVALSMIFLRELPSELDR